MYLYSLITRTVPILFENPWDAADNAFRNCLNLSLECCVHKKTEGNCSQSSNHHK